MKRFTTLIGTLVATAWMTPAVAQNDPGAAGTAIASGECSRLITGADDYTSQCDSQIASVTMDDGAVMFVYSIDGVPVGFLGDGTKVTQHADGVGQLPITFIAVGHQAEIAALDAEGLCRYSDPHAGPAFIWCTALTRGGPFVAAFKTDGNPPATEPSQ